MVSQLEVDIGRSPTCAIRLPYPSVSGRHLRLVRSDDRWHVCDLGSKNGTLLDGRSIEPGEPVELSDGSRLRISNILITAVLSEDAGDGFTLTETGTMLRKLIADTDHEIGGAYFESGDETRFELPDSAFGLQPDEATPFLIDRRGHGFWLTPLGHLTADGNDVPSDGLALLNGVTLAANAGQMWTFYDPLQTYMEELDDAGSEADDDTRHSAEQFATTRSSPNHVLLVVGGAAVLLASIALLIVLEIV